MLSFSIAAFCVAEKGLRPIERVLIEGGLGLALSSFCLGPK
jgi:hypothetical protein